MSAITPQQVIELKNNSDFRNMTDRQMQDYAAYIGNQNGSDGNRGGQTEMEWARRRIVAQKILRQPTSSPIDIWVAHFLNFLKGQDVWQTDATTTINTMVTNGKFDELSQLTHSLIGAQEVF